MTRLLLGFFLLLFEISFAQLGLYGALQFASSEVIALQDQPLYFFNGATNNLKRRIYEHQNPKENSTSFSSRYNTFYLVYYEHFFNILKAIQREKQLKRWSRIKKEKLIATKNPEWNFLNDTI